MTTPASGEKLFMRDEGRRARASGPPPDLLERAARRLYILALLYAFIFFMAGLFPQFMDPADRARFTTRFISWGPGSISIAMALLVAGVARSRRLPLSQIMLIGLVFEVVGSYGIAVAEFADPTGLSGDQRLGLSWVAVWVLLYTVVVPNPPRRAVVATLVSVSSVPVVLALAIGEHPVPGLTPMRFFFGLVFPYLLVALMAYVGSRVVYGLGREVTRARELGGYRLIERLGSGGMGEVWRAEHHLLARPAAIKLVRTSDGSDERHHRELQERFGREAQATALMRSPHTIELYDFGMANDGTFYYVMELLEGFDLETLVKRFGPVPAERAVAMLAQVCHSLGEAHANGLIHRDIKPANVFVCRYGREVDFVKVLDFGMVKKRYVDDDDDTQLTSDHAVAGTPAYMAPEQVLGNRPVDARTDVYAVGCVAYWLITGQVVFTGKTAMEVVTLHAHETPVPPSARTELEVPPALEEVVMACLSKNPDERPASADALAAALKSIATRTTWTTERAHEWWDLHKPVRGTA
ncbi:MAG: serine/threonine protein kinase [Candidatus Krumholzibacteria bacterium]|nr:serine/threonine protein kinase [Candidatus Krumholzibacteria bacterium]